MANIGKMLGMLLATRMAGRGRYGSALGNYKTSVQRADLGDRGVFYRVGVGPMATQQDASALCGRLKSAGLDCFVRRN